MKQNHYYKNRERQYKNIKPCILVEKLLLDENNVIAYDYKFHCMNGRVEYIWVAIDRFGDFKSNSYDRDWNLMERNVHSRGKAIKKPA